MSGGLANIGGLMGGMPMNGIKNPADFAMPEPSPAPAPAPVQQPQPQPQQPMQAAEEPFSEDLLNSDVGFATWAIKNGYMNNTGQMLKDDPTGGKRWKAGAKWMPNNVGLAMKALQGKKPTGKDSEAIRKMESDFFGGITRSLTPQEEQDVLSIMPNELKDRGWDQGIYNHFYQTFKDNKANKSQWEQARDIVAPELSETFQKERKMYDTNASHARSALERIGEIERLLYGDSMQPMVGFAGTIAAKLGGTDAKTMQRYLENLQANLVMNTLAELKGQSRTGATGFGALSEKELELIKAAKTALSQDMNYDDFVRELGVLKRALNVINDYSTEYGTGYHPYSNRRKTKPRKQIEDVSPKQQQQKVAPQTTSEDEWEDI